MATFGVNKFLVTYPAIVKQQFPLHVPRTTVYGRLIGHHTIVNMDVSLDKIAERRGQPAVGTVATFPDQPLLEEMTNKYLISLKKDYI